MNTLGIYQFVVLANLILTLTFIFLQLLRQQIHMVLYLYVCFLVIMHIAILANPFILQYSFSPCVSLSLSLIISVLSCYFLKEPSPKGSDLIILLSDLFLHYHCGGCVSYLPGLLYTKIIVLCVCFRRRKLRRKFNSLMLIFKNRMPTLRIAKLKQQR